MTTELMKYQNMPADGTSHSGSKMKIDSYNSLFLICSLKILKLKCMKNFLYILRQYFPTDGPRSNRFS